MTVNNSIVRATLLAPVNDDIARSTKIIPLATGIVERPSNLLTSTDAVNALIQPAAANPVSPTAIAIQPVQPGGATLQPPIPDPGIIAPGETPGMGSKLVAWAKANPVPAIVIGVGAIYLLSKFLKGK